MRSVRLWFRRKLGAQHSRLIKIKDTPHSVALGAAIGMFFGFTPLFGLKTLLSIGVAWLCRSNKLASAVTVTLHDVMLPFAPVIYYWEYQFGMWILHGHFSRRPRFSHMVLRDYMEWTMFFTLGRPMLVGSLFLALPSAAIVYFFLRTLLARARLAPAEVGEGNGDQ
ncbi:MAG TPA: DUF2062 domain-containing protein [Chthoniobacterales bacterium]|nr:DUF2062 domain-containing protein [Chthoniobacterales bacterium]